MPRAEPIIEFVGVPGAGKSTIARAFRPMLPGAQGLQLPPAPFRGSPALLGRAASFLLSLRPVEANDLHRMLRLVQAHHVYETALSAPLVLEQGLIQRLWALLADRTRYGEQKLERFTEILARSAPDLIVRVRTPHDVAAARIAERPHGNSRYERMNVADTAARLGPADALYDRLVGLYRRRSAATIIEVSGLDPVDANVARITAGLGTLRAGTRRASAEGPARGGMEEVGP